MPAKITLSKDLKKLLDNKGPNGLVAQVRKEFNNRGPTKIKQAIIQDMIIGISPVKGKGKWTKYSDNYKDVIQGKAKFRGKGKGALRTEEPDEDYLRKSSPTKRISPVNLRHTGGLHKSLFSKISGVLLIIGFDNFLADIHNRQGAGKPKAVRRLLPTEKGENFNRRIKSVIIKEVLKAVDTIAKKFSGQ